MEIAGKVAVITGASMRIGEAIARIFADHGTCGVLLSATPRVPKRPALE